MVVSATSAAAIGVVHLTPGGVRAPPRFGWVRRVSIRGGRRSVGADPVRDPCRGSWGNCEFAGSDHGLRASTFGASARETKPNVLNWCSLHTHLGTNFLFSMSKKLGAR